VAGTVLTGPVSDALIARLRAAGCVFAEEEAAVLQAAAPDDAALTALADRRVAGEPLEVVVGWAQFCGLRVAVAPGVFVPRRRSELLAETAIALAANDAVVVLDLCCGTGALGAAVTAGADVGELHAVDIDPDAVACARRNLPSASVYEGDLFAPLPARLCGTVDLILANAPYVPTDAIALMPREARDHEHRVALDGGTDGLELQRAIITGAPDWLAPGGHLLMETSEDQSRATLDLMRTAGLSARLVSDDERGSTIAIGATARP
jgi:release factor glutamine methyltransferase